MNTSPGARLVRAHDSTEERHAQARIPEGPVVGAGKAQRL